MVWNLSMSFETVVIKSVHNMPLFPNQRMNVPHSVEHDSDHDSDHQALC